MTNREALLRLEQCNGTFIDQMYWIAASFENSDFKSFIGEISIQQSVFKKLFPDIAKLYGTYKEENDYLQALVDFNKYGLIAEIHLPRCHKFTFNKNKPLSWSVSAGNCRVEYVYAETLEQLMAEIEKVSEKVFEQYMKADRKNIK